MSSNNSMMSAPRFPEEKQLSGEENWRVYKREVVLALQSRMLMGFADGTIAQPRYPTATHSIYPPTAAAATPMYSITPLPEEWVARDAVAKSIIVTNIVDPVGHGVDDTKSAAWIWARLSAKFEKRNEQKIHLADSALRKCSYDPETTTMEEHERTMRNLLKRLHDAGGSCIDSQFRLIVLASMPKEWKPDVRNVPGVDSEAAFTHLHALYLEKKDEQDEEERNVRKVKAFMARHGNTLAFTAGVPFGMREGAKQFMNDTVCTNPNCGKRGHPIERCWQPGGGREGQRPKFWRVRGQKQGGNTTQNANTSTNANAAATAT